MSEATTTTEAVTERKPLTGFERGIQVVAFVSAGIGLLAMIGYLVLLCMKGYRISSDVDPQVTALVGDFIGGVAGALFALAATLLFYLALTLQRREFQNSLHELRISSNALAATEEHHKNTLTVMREEKEFNVCMAAIKDLEEDWEKLGSTDQRWNRVAHEWTKRFDIHGIGFSVIVKRYPLDKKAKFDFHEYQRIVDLVKRAGWVSESIASKTLSSDDRRYLAQIARPTLRDMWSKLSGTIQEVEGKAKALLDKDLPYNGFNYDKKAIQKHCERIRSTLLGPMEATWLQLEAL